MSAARTAQFGLGAAMLLAALAATASARQKALLAPSPIGEAIYRQGRLPGGRPLIAERDGGLRLEGADAACTNCHRRSGLGETEGRNVIPPVAGIYLFHPRGASADELDLPVVEGVRLERDPYTDETLTRAIRDGIAQDGHSLSRLMPRYALDDAAMGELERYLKLLTPGRVPGVTDTVLHFATIITPDADPVKRQGMLDVLENYFAEKNSVTRNVAPRLRSARRLTFRVARRWQLHVWQLNGPEGTWDAQLQAHLKAEPVFAVISGLGGKSWGPVQHFCEAQSLPCLFPNVDAPVIAEDDFYSVYFSKGVVLEAQLIAHELAQRPSGAGLERVIQVYRAGDVGEAAAQALTRALQGSGLALLTRSLKPEPSRHDVADAVQEATQGDAVILWLRPKDLAALPDGPARASSVALSGIMGGFEEAPVPVAWRKLAHVAYPVDLPERRVVRLDYPQGWFHIRQIPVVAFKVQADTYLACGLLAETLSHMTDTFVRDYLLERLEDDLDHRIITGYYPRLTLGPRQRFASKGGYIVQFADPTGPKVTAVSDWITP